MITKFEAKSSRLNKVLWLISLTVIVALVAAKYYMATISQSFSRAIIASGTLLSIIILTKTNELRLLYQFWQGSCEEVKKITWATKHEITQTCLAIFVMVLVMGILLWTADSLLVWAMNKCLLGGV